MSKAIVDVVSERIRQQTDEGWSREHDDHHADGELVKAAVCYLRCGEGNPVTQPRVPHNWPLEVSAFKPKDRRANLVRAAALVVAEIERFDREAALEVAGDDEKLVAILGGGDWTDASLNHLIVPSAVDMENAKSEWIDWRTANPGSYVKFSDWLVYFKNSRYASERTLETFDDD